MGNWVNIWVEQQASNCCKTIQNHNNRIKRSRTYATYTGDIKNVINLN